ncbi:hypothetical protein P154DRAFT_120907 [Amniculicola lignicola CBS 123094]|uniref:Zinc-binding loop region of homing endonuclease domain-containing protein n=1 Tax=Amniculicola lignicola CBS 123094 TaxID=1392246 RepID=A0A6A5X3P5_9PLEO|nr:hypothetical protein P154DRAFT_120907 [Amniculicola lignicola CBS 123094]
MLKSSHERFLNLTRQILSRKGNMSDWATPIGAKRKTIYDVDEEDHQEPPKKQKLQSEIVVIDDDEKGARPLVGDGSRNNPFMFGWWSTGDIINQEDDGKMFTVVEGDDSDIEVIERRQRPGFRPATPIMDLGDFFDVFKENTPTAQEQDLHGEKGDGQEDADVDDGNINDDDDDDDQSVIFEFEIIKPPGIGNTPWIVSVKEEDAEDDVPELTCSQTTEASNALRSPSPLLDQDTLNNSRFMQAEDDPLQTEDGVSRLPSIGERMVPKRFQVTMNDIPTDRPLTVIEKKEIFFNGLWMQQREALQTTVDRYLSHVEGDLEEEECWLYKGPRLPQLQKRSITLNIGIRCNGKRQKISLNFGFVSMLLKDLLTEEQKLGIIQESWHCSHLCGNWTCMNVRHLTAEAGKININRNPCFRNLYGSCEHFPKCRKELKKPDHELFPDYLNKDWEGIF